MSAAIEALRHSEADLQVRIEQHRIYVAERQEEVSKATTGLQLTQNVLSNLNDSLLEVQQGIEDLDAVEQAREAANAPDQPTNIPDHAVPWTPIEPAEGEE